MEYGKGGLSASIRNEKITAALINVQAEIEGAKKASTNPHLQTKYADLLAVWDAVRGPLSENGLHLLQSAATEFLDRGGVFATIVRVTSKLTHVSGEFYASDLCMPVPNATPQGIGSAISYAKRYAMSALLGIPSIADEEGRKCDDDAETAQGRGTTRSKPSPQPEQKKRTEANAAPAKKPAAASAKAPAPSAPKEEEPTPPSEEGLRLDRAARFKKLIAVMAVKIEVKRGDGTVYNEKERRGFLVQEAQKIAAEFFKVPTANEVPADKFEAFLNKVEDLLLAEYGLK
jgi:pyruvate/2-oxoglutarate dehydrogenase complex dihydrolipoamide acyltransferase (E2) component